MQKTIFLFLLFIAILSCNDNKPESKLNKELLNSSSLYLQMHASNPVDWHLWSDSIWQNAKHQNKLVLLSIGYSACHWCHVMENESFEDTTVAKIMNRYYYNVKIDREKNPDVDAYYANIQKRITGWAGWPMHFILNSDKKVIWTGIYLKNKDWKALLLKIVKAYEQNPDTSFIDENIEITDNKTILATSLNFNHINQQIIAKLDTEKGGLLPIRYNRKYPTPYLLRYLLNQYIYTKNDTLGHFVKTSLLNMYHGGIFDQIEGGFFRFSMDEDWHIPHFEKMLYINAALISLYADASLVFKDKEMLNCALKTSDFVLKEMKSGRQLFYSSLDADTETEGAYYIYSTAEIKQVLKSDYSLAKDYYALGEENIWHDKFHLMRMENDKDFAIRHRLSINKWLKIKIRMNHKLLQVRENRTKPLRDNKLITSWNALMMEALLKSWKVSGKKKYLDAAESIILFFKENYSGKNGLKHFYLDDGTSGKNVYPEDYLYLIKAFIKHYRIRFDENSLLFAQKLYQEYLQTGFKLKFPDKDESLPSYLAMELYITEAFNFYFNENNEPVKLDMEVLADEPQKYGLVLAYLYNKEYFDYGLKVVSKNKQGMYLCKFLSETYLPYLKIALKTGKSKLNCFNGVELINDSTTYYFCKGTYCEKPTAHIDLQILTSPDIHTFNPVN